MQRRKLDDLLAIAVRRAPLAGVVQGFVQTVRVDSQFRRRGRVPPQATFDRAQSHNRTHCVYTRQGRHWKIKTKIPFHSFKAELLYVVGKAQGFDVMVVSVRPLTFFFGAS